MSYICEACGRLFESGWSDEEALAEFRQKYPNYPLEEAHEICDDCYQRLQRELCQ